MSQAEELKEEAILEKLRRLSLDKEWLEFDEWAINLAREKGFANLTEGDVARIVSDFRGGR
jgi:hypothetical protein